MMSTGYTDQVINTIDGLSSPEDSGNLSRRLIESLEKVDQSYLRVDLSKDCRTQSSEDCSEDGSEGDDNDVSDDSDGEIGVRALAYDPKQLTNSDGIPVNGHDYLRFVQEERDKLPAISTALVPAAVRSGKTYAHQDLVHRDQILANFLKLRSQIESVRTQSGSDVSGVQDINDEQEIKQVKNSKRANKSISRCERRAAKILGIINLGHPPQLDYLVHKSQWTIHLTLDRLAEQCEKAPIYSTLHADWVYSLMALLREPIEPDICSTLRRLAKLCITRRDSYERRLTQSSESHERNTSMNSSKELVDAINDEEYYACLLIICIVKYHFGQADLK